MKLYKFLRTKNLFNHIIYYYYLFFWFVARYEPNTHNREISSSNSGKSVRPNKIEIVS